MMRLARPRGAIVLALACLAGPAQSCASAQTNAARVYRIAGTLVNAVTGAPVPGATVAVLGVEDSHRIAAVQTGNDGSFAIGGLAAAKYHWHYIGGIAAGFAAFSADGRWLLSADSDAGDLLSFAVVTIPQYGALYTTLDGTTPLLLISSLATLPGNRVIFVPVGNDLGSPYDSFGAGHAATSLSATRPSAG